MIYVYDILLNFNKNLIEYFEWKDTDNIKYAKKITLFKINKKTMKDFLNNEIEFSIDFIRNTNKYELDGLENKTSFCLFTDGNIVLGTAIKNRKIDLVSRLIIDEEDEVITIAERLKPFHIDYKIIKAKEKSDLFLTRKEKELKNKLKKEIDKLYKENKCEKLGYLYYEYTGKEKNNINYVYNYLINSLDIINSKHEKLLDILKLSNKNKI